MFEGAGGMGGIGDEAIMVRGEKRRWGAWLEI